MQQIDIPPTSTIYWLVEKGNCKVDSQVHFFGKDYIWLKDPNGVLFLEVKDF